MFNKILIANRGEIACRIINTAKRLGIATVAVYSDADQHARHVALADEAVHIGPSPANESYLLAGRIINAARKTRAEAIHPGYGFLSENSAFCRQCTEQGLVFIGPPASAIEAMGSKSAAKTLMAKAGVPLLPGYNGDDQQSTTLQQAAEEIGYPVLLKAVAGGGGKGMRQVWQASEFNQALAAAKREALASVGSDAMLVEKYLTQPRHVEVQIFCDQQGHGVYLFERDCSVQRRHQKIIEEAPAPHLTDALRQQMGETALRAAQAIDYQGAGTVEFLLDRNGHFYFMEMNTRLQVEHPITEMITGQDLVEWQLLVAAGETLPLSQAQLSINGHAFEARLYAEDPEQDFLPASGTIEYLRTPDETDHVRIDSGVMEGDEVSSYYDPMIAKLIVWGSNRELALRRLGQCLSQYHISGVTTNVDFLKRLSEHPAFAQAEVHTGFIEQHSATLFNNQPIAIDQQLALACLYLQLATRQRSAPQANDQDPYSPWNHHDHWRLNAHFHQSLTIVLAGKAFQLRLEKSHHQSGQYILHGQSHSQAISGTLQDQTLCATLDGHRQTVTVVAEGQRFRVFTANGSFSFEQPNANPEATHSDDNHAGFTAPMNGTVVDIAAPCHVAVSKGDTLLVMEAMKMEHAIRAPVDGIVSEYYCQTGDRVDGGATLLRFEPTV